MAEVIVKKKKVIYTVELTQKEVNTITKLLGMQSENTYKSVVSGYPTDKLLTYRETENLFGEFNYISTHNHP